MEATSTRAPVCRELQPSVAWPLEELGLTANGSWTVFGTGAGPGWLQAAGKPAALHPLPSSCAQQLFSSVAQTAGLLYPLCCSTPDSRRPRLGPHGPRFQQLLFSPACLSNRCPRSGRELRRSPHHQFLTRCFGIPRPPPVSLDICPHPRYQS